MTRYLVGTFTRFATEFDYTFAEVNGEPALLATADDTVVGVLVPEFAEDQRIGSLHILANPAKLNFVARQLAGLSHSGEVPGSS